MMSAFLDMLSSVLAWLMAVAMVHFGAINLPAADTAPPATQPAQSHSESAVAQSRTPAVTPDDKDDQTVRHHS